MEASNLDYQDDQQGNPKVQKTPPRTSTKKREIFTQKYNE